MGSLEKKYAEALLTLSENTKQADYIGDALYALGRMFANNTEFRYTVLNPLISLYIRSEVITGALVKLGYIKKSPKNAKKSLKIKGGRWFGGFQHRARHAAFAGETGEIRAYAANINKQCPQGDAVAIAQNNLDVIAQNNLEAIAQNNLDAIAQNNLEASAQNDAVAIAQNNLKAIAQNNLKAIAPDIMKKPELRDKKTSTSGADDDTITAAALIEALGGSAEILAAFGLDGLTGISAAETPFGSYGKPIADAGVYLLRFLQMLLEKGRLAFLPVIAEEYQSIKAKHRGAICIIARSPEPLDDGELGRLSKKYMLQYGAETAEIKNIVEPSMFGGVSVQIGNMLIDDTAYGRLAALARAIASRAVMEAAEAG